MAKKKKATKPEPRPSYAPMTKELGALTASLAKIIRAREDEKGRLDDLQFAQAQASMQALNAAAIALECPQGFGPYDPDSQSRFKSKSKK